MLDGGCSAIIKLPEGGYSGLAINFQDYKEFPD
jgi:hypothetical protein